jgi:undecaprenyl pyrophosphate synthase
MVIRPFSENANESEREVLLLMILVEALFDTSIRFDSVDEYNLIFKVISDLRDDLGSLDNAIEMEIDDEEDTVEIRLAEEVRPENRDIDQEDYADEPEYQRLYG